MAGGTGRAAGWLSPAHLAGAHVGPVRPMLLTQLCEREQQLVWDWLRVTQLLTSQTGFQPRKRDSGVLWGWGPRTPPPPPPTLFPFLGQCPKGPFRARPGNTDTDALDLLDLGTTFFIPSFQRLITSGKLRQHREH